MMSAPILWKELILLVKSRPKPPIRARVREEGRDGIKESVVFFDGLDLWFIDNGKRIQITHPQSSLFWENERLENVRSMGVAADDLAKAIIVGSFAYLDNTDGVVTGEDNVLTRPCWIAETSGLRGDEPDASFRMWIDKEHGFTLRSEHLTEPAGRVEIVELVIGEIIRPVVRSL